METIEVRPQEGKKEFWLMVIQHETADMTLDSLIEVASLASRLRNQERDTPIEQIKRNLFDMKEEVIRQTNFLELLRSPYRTKAPKSFPGSMVVLISNVEENVSGLQCRIKENEQRLARLTDRKQ